MQRFAVGDMVEVGERERVGLRDGASDADGETDPCKMVNKWKCTNQY